MNLRTLYPRDHVDWALLGWIAACLVIVAVEARLQGRDAAQSDDGPDWAMLRDCDLQALKAGNAQTVPTGQGDTVRLEGAAEWDQTDE